MADWCVYADDWVKRREERGMRRREKRNRQDMNEDRVNKCEREEYEGDGKSMRWERKVNWGSMRTMSKGMRERKVTWSMKGRERVLAG